MQRSVLSLLVFCAAVPSATGAERKFPYEAVIDVAEEYVRSGPGQKFYPTSQVRRGTRVTVHRHDPGGWVMISPPEGSFSWIQADYVRQKSKTAGVLTDNNVIVRVGSQFNDERDWYQRELSRGDVVEILGEQNFETDRGPVKMLKIKPPSHEYRWILGKALLPADAPVKQPLKQRDVAETAPAKRPPLLEKQSDPFDAEPAPSADVFEQPLTPKNPAPIQTESIRQTGPAASELEEQRSRLAAIDQDLHAMIEEDPATWNLASLEQRYHQLESQSDMPVFKSRIAQQLKAIARYEKIQQEYMEFVRLTAETKQRDAQLMSLSAAPNASTASSATPPASPGPAAPGKPRNPPLQPKTFDGAGVIQRAGATERGGPQFVLVTPGGRLLAYLQPAPGIDLNAHVGQTMGVIGQRSFRQELQGELIVVRSLHPVRLKGP